MPPTPYFVLLSRAEQHLDLQAAFDATYDLLGYDLAINYGQPPDVPLDAATAQWAATLLAAHQPHNDAM